MLVPQSLRYRRQAANQERPEPGQDALADREAARRAVADPAMFEPLFSKYWGPILRYCSLRIHDAAEAEDVAIQVMTNAFAALPRFAEGSGHFRSWIFAIAHNEVVNVYRAQSRQKTSPLTEEIELIDPAPTPEQVSLDSDDRQRLWRLLEGLPQRSREVVELRLSGFTGQEIASLLGISDGAVRQAQSRALDQLRVLVIDDDLAPEVRHV
jgi:RNA polymerase sigma-70 factor, ECF subfamily